MVQKSAGTEHSYRGHSLLTILDEYDFGGRRFVLIQARVCGYKLMDFSLPKSALPHLKEGRDFKDLFFVEDGYEIVTKNGAVHYIYIAGEMVYDRVRDGF